MLCGKDFRGCHDTGFHAIIKRNEHRHQGYNRFSTAYIALQQSIHLPSRTHILPDLFDHPFLGIGEFKRQIFLVKCIYIMADFTKNMPFDLLSADIMLTQ